MAKSVRDAMTEDPRSIGATASVVEAARLMREQHIGSLPVTEDERLVGMITDRDITTRVVAASGPRDDVSRGRLLSRPDQCRARQRPRPGTPADGPSPGSAAPRCRERQTRRHGRAG
jgi:CBS-domain-containing membrane protein